MIFGGKKHMNRDMYMEKGRLLGHFKSNGQSAPETAAKGNHEKKDGEPETGGPITDAGNPERK